MSKKRVFLLARDHNGESVEIEQQPSASERSGSNDLLCALKRWRLVDKRYRSNVGNGRLADGENDAKNKLAELADEYFGV